MRKIHTIGIAAVGIIALVAGVCMLRFQKKENIPPLLDRKGPISTTSEWRNTKKAIESLQTQIRQNPKDSKAKLWLALAYMQEARITGEHPYYYPAALELLDQILDDTPEKDAWHQQALVAKASVQLSLHHFTEALEIGEEMVKTSPPNAEMYGILCDAYVELGHYEKAVEVVDKMVALKPDLRSYSRVSYLREIHGDLAGAIDAMELAVSAGFPGLEQTAWTRVTLGKLYEKRGDLAHAAMHYSMALEETPHYAFAVAGQARIAASKKNYKEALDLYAKAATIIPEFSFTEEMAQVYQLLGEKQKAKDEALRVVDMLEEDAEAGHAVDLELANLYATLLEDDDKALTYAEEAYEKRPDNIDVNRCLALVYYKKGDFAKAAAYAKAANRTKRQDPDLLMLSGLIGYKSGNKKEGIALMRQSLVKDPCQQDELAMEAKKLMKESVLSL